MATERPRARKLYGDPSHPKDPVSLSLPLRKIRFRHPNYPHATNILLQFSACDANNGIHYQTAHDACAIVANNRWDGYLSTDVEGAERIEPLSPDESLDKDDYYFHVPEGKDYAIIPNFADWPFPHQNLPLHWSRQLQETLINPLSYQTRCCMTRSAFPLENAHIVPANPSDLNWWRINGMSQYVTHAQASNKLRLRLDVHQIFDRKPRFAVVPKYDALVAHFFDVEGAAEAVELYHNVPLQHLDGVKIEFLLARMAWTVFPYLGIFMSAQRRRKVWRLDENGDRVVEELDGEKCIEIYRQAQAKSRSVSPRKRAIGRSIGGEEELQDGYAEQDDGEEDVDDWNTRGRKRRRVSYGTPSSEALDRSGSEVSESIDALVLTSLKT